MRPAPKETGRDSVPGTSGPAHVGVADERLDLAVVAGYRHPPEPYPEERWAGDVEHRAMAVVAWYAVNFGSGWFPHVAKVPGRSGARTLATRWHEHCDGHGVPTAGWLRRRRSMTWPSCSPSPWTPTCLEVPLYKRAQIVVSHLAGALVDTELERFDDLHTLTAFADNLMPQRAKGAWRPGGRPGPRRPHRARGAAGLRRAG